MMHLFEISTFTFAIFNFFFFFSSRRRHTRLVSDWSSDVCSSDLSNRDSRYTPPHMSETSPYLSFDRTAWAALRAETPMTLAPDEVAELSGVNEDLSLTEVEEVYLPLSRLLNLHVAAFDQLHRVSSRFLGTASPKVPYVIAIGGSGFAG